MKPIKFKRANIKILNMNIFSNYRYPCLILNKDDMIVFINDIFPYPHFSILQSIIKPIYENN